MEGGRLHTHTNGQMHTICTSAHGHAAVHAYVCTPSAHPHTGMQLLILRLHRKNWTCLLTYLLTYVLTYLEVAQKEPEVGAAEVPVSGGLELHCLLESEL